jgi:seryl-tRNA synthetase
MSAEDFRRGLFDTGLLTPGGAQGLYHRSFTFESVIRGVEAYLTKSAKIPPSRQLHFSPVMARSTLERSGYIKSFPDLIGTISSFEGSESDLRTLVGRLDADEAWSDLLTPTGVTLCSAACHSLYPIFAGTSVPEDGLVYEVQASCFRHEPSANPARMQSFRQHEFVYLGTPDGALKHRDGWLEKGQALLSALGLDVEAIVANDPFFGRAGQLLATSQREKTLKFEIVTAITSTDPGAISSANYHEDHFGLDFDITSSDGTPIHSACIGFGLERITLALLHQHGLAPSKWPDAILTALSLDVTLPQRA